MRIFRTDLRWDINQKLKSSLIKKLQSTTYVFAAAVLAFSGTLGLTAPTLVNAVGPPQGDPGLTFNPTSITALGTDTESQVVEVSIDGLSGPQSSAKAELVISVEDSAGSPVSEKYLQKSGSSQWESDLSYDINPKNGDTIASFVFKADVVDDYKVVASGERSQGDGPTQWNATERMDIEVVQADEPTPATGEVQIAAYVCEDGTSVNWSANGPEGNVPETCEPLEGAQFGYVEETDKDPGDTGSPWERTPIASSGLTNASGMLTFSDLSTEYRHGIVALDGFENPKSNDDVLFFGCDDDAGGTGGNVGDNYEYAFPSADTTKNCVYYNLASETRYVAETGDDATNDCLLETAPCRTIQHAINQADEGNMIMIAAGTYEESVNVNKNGLTIRGEGSGVVTVDVAGTGPNSRGFDVSGSSSNLYQDITLEGFTVANSDPSAFGLKIAHVHNLTLNDVVAKDNGRTGIDLNTVVNAVITGAEAHSNAGAGIAFRNMTNVTASDMNTSDNAWGGLALWAQPGEELTDVSVSGSSFSNEPAGVFVQHAGTYANTSLTGNIFTDNEVQVSDQTGINALNMEAVLSDNNFDRATVVRDNPIVVPAIFSKIQDGVDAAAEGQIVEVHTGTYVEDVLVQTDNIILTSTEVDERGPNTVVKAATNISSPPSYAIMVQANGVTVEGFTVADSRNGIGLNGNNNVVTSNTVNDQVTWNGVVVQQGNANEVGNNTVHNNPARGIFVRDGATGTNVHNNDVRDTVLGSDASWHGGIVIDGSESTVQFNIACGNTPWDVLINGNDNTIANNTFGTYSDMGTGNHWPGGTGMNEHCPEKDVTVVIDNPSEGTTLAGVETIEGSVSGADVSFVDRVRLILQRNDGGSWSVEERYTADYDATTNQYAKDIDTTELPDGEYRLLARAFSDINVRLDQARTVDLAVDNSASNENGEGDNQAPAGPPGSPGPQGPQVAGDSVEEDTNPQQQFVTTIPAGSDEEDGDQAVLSDETDENGVDENGNGQEEDEQEQAADSNDGFAWWWILALLAGISILYLVLRRRKHQDKN